MSLHIDVYRNADGTDCTNSGITKRFVTLNVVNVNGPSSPNMLDVPNVYLEPGYMDGTCHLVPGPEFEPDVPFSRMFGGNYAGTSDSRFKEAVENLIGVRFYGAIPVHDRYET
jgi:hypothetical protein